MEAIDAVRKYNFVQLLKFGGTPMGILSLEYSYWWLQAVTKEQESKERGRGCPLCQEVDWVWTAVSEEQPWEWKSHRKTVGKNQWPSQQRELYGWGLLQTAWSRGACWWSISAPATEAHRLSSCWGTSTVLLSAGKVAQWAVGNPGDSWNA